MEWYEDDWCNKDILQLRNEITEIDHMILNLIKERMSICEKLGRIKIVNGLPIYDPEQEERVIKRWINRGRFLGLEEDFVRELSVMLIDHSKKIQLNQCIKEDTR